LQSVNYGSEVVELGATSDYLLAVGIDQAVKVFNRNGDVVLERPAPKSLQWWAIQFAPGGKQILFAEKNGDLLLLDQEGKTIRTGRFSDPIDVQRYSFIFLENGSIQIASPEAAGWIWQTNGQVRSLSSNSSLLAPAEPKTYNILQEKKLLLHPKQGTPLPEVIHLKRSSSIPEATFSHSGQYIISSNQDSLFYLWSVDSAPIQQTQLARPNIFEDMPGYFSTVPDSIRHTLSIDQAKWAPSGNRLFTTSSYQSKLWSADCQQLAVWDALSGLQDVYFSNDGALLMTIYSLYNGAAGLSVRDSMGKEMLNLTFPNDTINQVLPVPDTSQLVILLNSGRLLEYSLSQQQVILQKKLEHSPTVGVFTTNGDRLFLGFRNGWIKKWDRRTDSINDLIQHRNNIFELDIEEEKELLLSASDDGSARLSTFTGEPIREMRMGNKVRNVHFSPPGHHFFIRDRDNLLRLFSSDGKDSLVLGSVNPVEEAIFSADGDQLLLLEETGSKIQLRLVDLSGQTLAVYPHYSTTASMAISPNGLRMYSFEDATARTWLTPSGVLDWLKNHPLAPFSEEEKKSYMLNLDL